MKTHPLTLAATLLLAACGGGDPAPAPVQTATAQQYEWAALTMEPYVQLVDVDAAGSPEAAVDRFLAGYRWVGRSVEPEVFVNGSDRAGARAVAHALAAAGVKYVSVIE